MEPVGHPGGQVRVEPGGRVPLQLLPPHHVGAAAGEESHGCPVSEAPLDQLVGPDVQSDGGWDGWSPGTEAKSLLHSHSVFYYFVFFNRCTFMMHFHLTKTKVNFLLTVKVANKEMIKEKKRTICCQSGAEGCLIHF